MRDGQHYVPGVSEMLRIETLDTADGAQGSTAGSARRSSPRPTASARQHGGRGAPDRQAHRLNIDLTADMKSPPLLAGGTGRWWYGIPETYGYPSRSFQYMQGARR